MNVQKLLKTTTQEVINLNTQKALQLERIKVALALSSLERIIKLATEANAEWNPEVERATTAIIVEAENSLRQVSTFRSMKLKLSLKQRLFSFYGNIIKFFKF